MTHENQLETFFRNAVRKSLEKGISHELLSAMIKLAWGMSKREEDMLRQARLCNTIGLQRQQEIVKEETTKYGLTAMEKDISSAMGELASRVRKGWS